MNTHQEEIVVGSKVYDSEHGRGVVVKVSKAHYTIQFGFMTMVREKKQVRLQR